MSDDSERTERTECGASSIPHPIEMKTSEEMVTFMVCILSTLLQRRIDNTQAQLEKLKHLNKRELAVLWQQLNQSAPLEDALHIFTNWIEGQLDGDGLSS